MERTFVGAGIKSVLSESLENLSDMFPVVVKIIGVDQDVVQINKNTYIQKIGDDVIHKTLKSCKVFTTLLIGVSMVETLFTPVYGTVH